MKKIAARILCLVMVVGLMTGCAKDMDLKTLTQKMDAHARNITAMAGKLTMDLEMSVGLPGMTLAMGLIADGEVKMDLAENDLWADVDAALEMLGQTEEMGLEVYADITGDGSGTMYLRDSEADSWVRYVRQADASRMESLEGISIGFSEIPQDKLALAEEKQMIGSTVCYVLSAELDGAYLGDQMKEIMSSGIGSPDEETAAMMKNIDWSAVNVKAVYYVDAETFSIVRMDMEIQGLGDMLGGILDAALEETKELLGGEDMTITVDIPVCKIGMSEMTDTGVKIPPVPQEAVDNAVDGNVMAGETIVEEQTDDVYNMIGNPAQSDGSYLLRCDDMTARVTIPEGFVVYASEEDFLMLMTEDMAISVTYTLVGGTDAAAVGAEYEDTVRKAKDEGYWLSDGDSGDIEGFTVRNLICNDGTSELYAWKEASGGVVKISSVAYMQTPAVHDILSSIEIG